MIEVSTCLPLTSPSYVLVCSLPQADNAMIQTNATTINEHNFSKSVAFFRYLYYKEIITFTKNDVIQKFKFCHFWRYEVFEADFSQSFKIIKSENDKAVGNVVCSTADFF